MDIGFILPTAVVSEERRYHPAQVLPLTRLVCSEVNLVELVDKQARVHVEHIGATPFSDSCLLLPPGLSYPSAVIISTHAAHCLSLVSRLRCVCKTIHRVLFWKWLQSQV